MPLAPGSHLGPYEIVGALGAGGMGEVYRGRDTRLDRTVAIKALPSQYAADPDFRARFEREARAIASLNHPNICAIYDVGHQDGTDYLVMELLEGETLSERLKRGALPVDQALFYAGQIADALDRAHGAGIIHRDLKPGNIMLARGGGPGPVTAKLLDFGLAKSQIASEPPSPEFTPTSLPTTPAHPLTAQGMILGTFQYMAPEQLEGREADARTDIFAFGCVLYEMLTGRRAFEGKSQASLIAAVISGQPEPVSKVQPLAPASLDFVVSTCLAKDPEARFQSARDLAAQLRWLAGTGSQPDHPLQPVSGRSTAGSRLAWTAAGVATLGALALAVPAVRYLTETPAVAPTLRFDIMPPENGRFDDSPAISPDGQQLVFVASDRTGVNHLWIRPLDALEARELPGTEDATYPFWSPDSRSVAFFAASELRKVDTVGGQPQTLCPATLGRGGTWNAGGVIVFAGTNITGLQRVPASGGTPVEVTHFDASRQETSHRFPHFLPDGRHFLYLTLNNDLSKQGVFLGSLDSPESTLLIEGADGEAQYNSGYILFGRKFTLMARPFDPGRLAFTSPDAFPVVNQIAGGSNTGALSLAASTNGTLVYRGGDVAANSRITWFDREGRSLGTVGEPGLFTDLTLSPDGSRVAVGELQNNNQDIWIVQLSRGIARRLTFDPAADDGVAWSPDGNTLAYASETGNVPANLFTIPAAGGAEPKRLFESSDAKTPAAWTPDGRTIVYSRQNLQTGTLEIWTIPADGDGQPKPLLASAFNYFQPALSPDGRWLAYTSNETGRYEVYVRSFPDGTAAVQASTAGGAQPRWRRDGRELFYLALDGTLTAVPVQLQTPLDVDVPQPLFRIPITFSITNILAQVYDVALDGRRFIVSAPVEGHVTPLTLVLNWAASAGR